MEIIQCPICKRTDATQKQCPEGRDSSKVHCPNCSTYEISGTAFVTQSNKSQNTRLSFAIRERTTNGKEYVKINSENYKQLTEGIDYPITIKEKAELVLKIVFKDEKAFIHGFDLNDTNRVISNIESADEMAKVIRLMDGKEWFDMTRDSKGGTLLSVIGKGKEYAGSILFPTLNSDQIFVAMSLNEELAGVYEEGIKKALDECRLTPCRIERREFNAEITSKILDGITKSRFLIADFTGHILQ